jgi:hypothetical protein
MAGDQETRTLTNYDKYLQEGNVWLCGKTSIFRKYIKLTNPVLWQPIILQAYFSKFIKIMS